MFITTPGRPMIAAAPTQLRGSTDVGDVAERKRPPFRVSTVLRARSSGVSLACHCKDALAGVVMNPAPPTAVPPAPREHVLHAKA